MIPISPLFNRYKDSYLLFLFRFLDLTRVSLSKDLSNILYHEVIYMYQIGSLVVYKTVKERDLDELFDWFRNLSSEKSLENVKSMYEEKMNILNLKEMCPYNYTFTFTTIWDTIHFLCIIVDDLVMSRNKYTFDFVKHNLQNIKSIFFNMFIILMCPVCANHYLQVKGFLISELEHIEISLYRESQGEPIIFQEEETRSISTKNVLLTNHMLYKSMVFHNRVNGYRPIQRNYDKLNNFKRMDWNRYKNELNMHI